MANAPKPLLMIAAIGLISLAATGCDKQAQKDAEITADAIENSADRLNTRIDNIAANAQDKIETKADMVSEKADAATEEISDRADAVVKAVKGK